MLIEAQGNRQESLRFWREVLEMPPNGGATSYIRCLEQAGANLGSSPTGLLPSAENGS
jgi:hypothetical protein